MRNPSDPGKNLGSEGQYAEKTANFNRIVPSGIANSTPSTAGRSWRHTSTAALMTMGMLLLAQAGCGMLLGVGDDKPLREAGTGAYENDAGDTNTSGEISEPVPPGPDGKCAGGTKLCSALCVSTIDPNYGCNAESCDACAGPANGNGAVICSAQGACGVTCSAGFTACAQGCCAGTSTSGIAAGLGYTCTLLTGGTVKCWGLEGPTGSDVPTNAPGSALPGLAGVRAITGGGAHVCALLAGGTVKCWGLNDYGQLGNGNKTSTYTPTDVLGLGGVKAIRAGLGHTCALLAGGTVKCWGLNEYGQLGNGSTTTANTPVNVAGLASVEAIAAGGGHTCALVAGGTVKCWGAASMNGHNADASSPGNALSGLAGVQSLAAGLAHTCAVLLGGTVKCWGNNAKGQLGNGNNILVVSPATTVSGLANADAIATGMYHTCALLAGGSVKCWGYNSTGQLGNGSNIDTNAPGNAISGLSSVQAIAAGGTDASGHTCALLANGSAKCWGDNQTGALGNGSNTNSNVPVTVAGLP